MEVGVRQDRHEQSEIKSTLQTDVAHILGTASRARAIDDGKEDLGIGCRGGICDDGTGRIMEGENRKVPEIDSMGIEMATPAADDAVDSRTGIELRSKCVEN